MKARLALAVAACLVATMHADGPAWSVARSERFEVYATGSPERATGALEMFEKAHAFFTSYLALPSSTRRATRVLVFSGDKEYAPYRVNESDNAFFQPSRERDYIVMKTLGRDAFHVVAHEYAHAALGLKGADLPPWLAEGLAEFFSTVQLQGDTARLGLVPDGRLQALSKGRLMSVPDLLEVQRGSPEYNERDDAGRFYAESWALTHMLFADKRYRDGSATLLGLIQQGKTSAEALADVYGKTLHEIQKDFSAYTRRDTYVSFTVPCPRVAKQMAKPSPVPAFEASLVVADLLSSQIGKEAETRAALDALDQEQPDHVTVLELRAFIELRTFGGAAALASFERAVRHGSQNPLILAQLALLIGQRDPELASDLLKRAVVLAPDNAEIRIRAAAALIGMCKPAEALSTIAAVTRIPSNLESAYYQAVAAANTALGRSEAADAATAKLATVARAPQQQAAWNIKAVNCGSAQ